MDATPEATSHLSTEDAIVWLDRLPSGSADLVVLDPGPPGRVVRSRKQAVASFPIERMSTLLHEVQRVLKSGRVCWWLCESAHLVAATRLADKHGFSIGAPVVWDRVDGHPRLAFALPLTRGRARSPGAELVVAPRISGESWPGELPEALCIALIESATEPSEWVVDPFSGAGSVGVGAALTGRRYLGCDVLGSAATRAITRLTSAGARHFDDLDAAVSALGPRAEAPDLAKPRAIANGDEGPCQLTIFGDAARLA